LQTVKIFKKKHIIYSMKISFSTVLSVIIVSCFTSCNQNEGLGGSSSIEGYVYNVVHQDDNYSFQTDTFPALGKKVYLSFGDEARVGDDVDAGLDGYFRFDYLREGNYTVYALSETASGEKQAESQKIKVGSGVAQVKNIYIHSGKAYGTAMIKGSVWAYYHHNGSEQGQGPATGMRVYIRHANETAYFDDMRVAKGTFIFQKILPGEYVVAVETEDSDENVSLIESEPVLIRETEKIYEIEIRFEVFVAV
jgi:hypothetical protein